jgi:hypothetical protein
LHARSPALDQARDLAVVHGYILLGSAPQSHKIEVEPNFCTSPKGLKLSYKIGKMVPEEDR